MTKTTKKEAWVVAESGREGRDCERCGVPTWAWPGERADCGCSGMEKASGSERNRPVGWRPCRPCGGTGKDAMGVCWKCRGSGEVPVVARPGVKAA